MQIVKNLDISSQLALEESTRLEKENYAVKLPCCVFLHIRLLLEICNVTQSLDHADACGKTLGTQTGQNQISLLIYHNFLTVGGIADKHTEIGDFAGIQDVLKRLRAANKG